MPPNPKPVDLILFARQVRASEKQKRAASRTGLDKRERRETYLPWTERRVAELIRLWDLPAMTCRKISRRLGGTTRSAVAAKARRLELPRRRSMKHWAIGAGLTFAAE